MTYSASTGDYESDFLERILDTDFRYGVPYKIDREKYESTLKEFHQEMRVEDADVLLGLKTVLKEVMIFMNVQYFRIINMIISTKKHLKSLYVQCLNAL